LELIIAEARQTIACIAHHPADRRLAWWLLECQDRTGKDRLALTQDFLGTMLGVQRTTVTQIAVGLKAEGLITCSRGVISILNRGGLEARSCECYKTSQHFRHLIEGGQAFRPSCEPWIRHTLAASRQAVTSVVSAQDINGHVML
jgi:DNA-binding XRE family transcriptional regulator